MGKPVNHKIEQWIELKFKKLETASEALEQLNLTKEDKNFYEQLNESLINMHLNNWMTIREVERARHRMARTITIEHQTNEKQQ